MASAYFTRLEHNGREVRLMDGVRIVLSLEAETVKLLIRLDKAEDGLRTKAWGALIAPTFPSRPTGPVKKPPV